LPQRNGAEVLDRHLCLEHLFCRHHRGEPADARSGRKQTGGAGVLNDATSGRGAAGLVRAACFVSHHGCGRNGVVEYNFLVGALMGIDIRFPLGALFSLLGLILIVYGAISDPTRYQQSLCINVSLDWGIVLLIFGLLMLLLARRGTRSAESAVRKP